MCIFYPLDSQIFVSKSGTETLMWLVFLGARRPLIRCSDTDAVASFHAQVSSIG